MKEYGIEYRRKVLCFLCDNEISTLDDKYCVNHICNKPRCHNAKFKGNYCGDHVCCYNGCVNESLDGRPYCYAHSN